MCGCCCYSCLFLLPPTSVGVSHFSHSPMCAVSVIFACDCHIFSPLHYRKTPGNNRKWVMHVIHMVFFISCGVIWLLLMISQHQEKVSRCKTICQVTKWCKRASTSPSIVSCISVRLCPLIVQLERQQMQHKDQVPKEKWSQSNLDHAHLDRWGLYIFGVTLVLLLIKCTFCIDIATIKYILLPCAW